MSGWCRSWRCLGGFALGLCTALLFAPQARAADPWATDPVFVYYPQRDCRGGEIDLEVWDRQLEEWRRHPGHPRVPIESCQLEDAGTLLHEIRWRCVEPPSDTPPPWIVGLDVFDPEIVESCAVGQRGAGERALEVHVASPAPGERVTAPRMEVAIEGSVWMNGIAGTEYDVVLVLDRSRATRRGAADLLASQVAAAHALLDRLAPRLGAIRVGVVTHPDMPPPPGSAGGTGARLELALSDDADAVRSALDGVLAHGASGFQTFASAFDFALDELAGGSPDSGARAHARKVVLLAANAREGGPFGLAASRDARFRSQLGERVMRAREGRVELHLFALGGLAEVLAPGMEALFERADARFQRVPHGALDGAYFSSVSLPDVRRVEVANRTAGGDARPASVAPDGRFQTTLVAASGTNRLWARATLSDGDSAEREWAFEFDDSLVRERLLALEREHMRRVREKRLHLREARGDEIDAPAVVLPPRD